MSTSSASAGRAITASVTAVVNIASTAAHFRSHGPRRQGERWGKVSPRNERFVAVRSRTRIHFGKPKPPSKHASSAVRIPAAVLPARLCALHEATELHIGLQAEGIDCAYQSSRVRSRPCLREISCDRAASCCCRHRACTWSVGPPRLRRPVRRTRERRPGGEPAPEERARA